MPEIVYTVKVVLDPSSEKIVGKAIDEGLEKGVKDAAAAIEKATGKQVTFNKVIEEGNEEIKERNNLLKANITNVQSANAQARNYDNTLKRLITDEKTDIATLRKKAEQHRNFIPILEESIAEMRAYGAATEMSKEESTRYNNTLAKSEQTLRTMMSTNINLNNSLHQSAGEMGDVTGQAGRFNKTMSGANQTIFAFSDLVQDSTQFMIGGKFNFAQGMRAIGNNVGFTAELFGNLTQNVQRYNQAVADGTIKNGQQVTRLQALRKSFFSTGGAVLFINAAVTIATVLLNKFGKKTEEVTEDLDDADRAATRFLETTDALIEALEKINILTSPEAAKKRRLAELDIEITRLQTIEQQNVQQERALRIALDTLNNSRIAQKIRFQEGVSLEKRQAFAEATANLEEEIADLVSGREERASTINALQEEQRKLGTQIRIDTEATAKAEAEALDILTKRRQEGQAQVDLLKEGRDLPPVRITGEIIIGKIGEGEDGKDILGEIFSPKMPELDLNQARIDANKAMFDAMFEDADAYAQAQRALNIDTAKIEINTRKMVLSTLSSLAGAFAQENKGIAFALLAIEKGLAIAEVIVNGQKMANFADSAAFYFSANPFTSGLGFRYAASSAAIRANTAATVAAIAAQGIGQAASISRAGGGGGGGASAGGGAGYGVGANTRFLPTAQQPEEDSFRAFGESVNFMPKSANILGEDKIIIEQNVKGKDLSLLVRAGNKELKSSQVVV